MFDIEAAPLQCVRPTHALDATFGMLYVVLMRRDAPAARVHGQLTIDGMNALVLQLD